LKVWFEEFGFQVISVAIFTYQKFGRGSPDLSIPVFPFLHTNQSPCSNLLRKFKNTISTSSVCMAGSHYLQNLSWICSYFDINHPAPPQIQDAWTVGLEAWSHGVPGMSNLGGFKGSTFWSLLVIPTWAQVPSWTRPGMGWWLWCRSRTHQLAASRKGPFVARVPTRFFSDFGRLGLSLTQYGLDRNHVIGMRI
jgi:hypothetical protein